MSSQYQHQVTTRHHSGACRVHQAGMLSHHAESCRHVGVNSAEQQLRAVPRTIASALPVPRAACSAAQCFSTFPAARN